MKIFKVQQVYNIKFFYGQQISFYVKSLFVLFSLSRQFLRK